MTSAIDQNYDLTMLLGSATAAYRALLHSPAVQALGSDTLADGVKAMLQARYEECAQTSDPAPSAPTVKAYLQHTIENCDRILEQLATLPNFAGWTPPEHKNDWLLSDASWALRTTYSPAYITCYMADSLKGASVAAEVWISQMTIASLISILRMATNDYDAGIREESAMKALVALALPKLTSHFGDLAEVAPLQIMRALEHPDTRLLAGINPGGAGMTLIPLSRSDDRITASGVDDCSPILMLTDQGWIEITYAQAEKLPGTP